MTFLERYERWFGRFTIPNFLPIWLFGQLMVFVGVSTQRLAEMQLDLNGRAVLSGEWWRVFSFLLVPATTSPLWILVSLGVAWLMGSMLIAHWGERRLTLLIGTAWALTVLASLAFPRLVLHNQYILWLLTLAFARVFPEMEFRLWFVIPVKVKYLAWILWGFYALALFTGELEDQVMVLAAVGAWLVFFGGDLLQSASARKRRAAFQRESRQSELVPMHTCSVCGKNNLSHPAIDFRYQNGKCVCAAYLQKGTCDET